MTIRLCDVDYDDFKSTIPISFASLVCAVLLYLVMYIKFDLMWETSRVFFIILCLTNFGFLGKSVLIFFYFVLSTAVFFITCRRSTLNSPDDIRKILKKAGTDLEDAYVYLVFLEGEFYWCIGNDMQYPDMAVTMQGEFLDEFDDDYTIYSSDTLILENYHLFFTVKTIVKNPDYNKLKEACEEQGIEVGYEEE